MIQGGRGLWWGGLSVWSHCGGDCRQKMRGVTWEGIKGEWGLVRGLMGRELKGRGLVRELKGRGFEWEGLGVQF